MTIFNKSVAAAFVVMFTAATATSAGAWAQAQTASTAAATDAAALTGVLQQALDDTVARASQQRLDFDAAQTLSFEALQSTIVAAGLSPLQVQQALAAVRATTRPSNAALAALKARVDATVVACYTQSQIDAARKGKAEIQRGSCAAGLSVAATGGDPAALSPAPSFAGASGGADYRPGS
ncbi:hypothetical protein [Caulobacter endophyticus]|uniref:hypothetical protein n=1 Tax=Caulobacter endophyticus TaxID=2172652 RepID=UPI00240F9526|nr:hypothetical protein [Caulobacter endophyticus]MDG2531896.1 hypothetical protein [Caulobacter endophyticus]